MILEEATQEKFGYSIDTISAGSNKKIIVKCDYCELERYEISMKVRNKSNSVVQKDSCNKCKYIKRDECCMLKYGVTNPGATKAVKDKIKETIRSKYGVDAYTQTAEFVEKANQTKISKYGTTNTNLVPEIRDKIKSTLMENYGVESPLQSDIIKNKAKQTNLAKYGKEEYLSTLDAREKIKESNLLKYGHENVFSNKEIQEQIKQTHLDNLGVEYPMQSDLVKNKAKETVQNKYGVDNVFESKEIQEKSRQTNLEKYGVEYPASLESIKNKIVNTNLEKYNVEYSMQNPDIKEKARQTAIKNGHIKIYDGKTMAQLSSELGQAYSTFVVRVREFGFDVACQMQSKENGLEAKLKMILDIHNIPYVQHARINGRYTDFLLEQHKLIIETDGIYWHSDKVLEDDKYHAKKRQDYLDAGYRCLFFREDEINNKSDIVQSIILNTIGMSKRIFGRKCQIKELDSIEASDFINQNHLMGRGQGKSYGLIYENKIVSIMQIKRLVGNQYEISRFCHLREHSVIGGFSKLLSYVEKSLKPESLTTYIDMRYGVGGYLSAFGFTDLGYNLSFRWVGDNITFHRMKYKSSSGYDIGLAKIWDCGQAKFKKSY